MLDLVAGVLDGLAGLHPGVLYLLAGLFTALETSVGVGLLVPGDGVVLLAGTTATTPHRFAALVTVTVLGSLAGESVGYLLGRRYGIRLRAGRQGRRLGEDRWVAAEAFLAGQGGRAVAAARFVAVSMRWCRSWPAPSGCPTGGWSAGARWGRRPGRCCMWGSARPPARPGGSTATGSAWPAWPWLAPPSRSC
jgi:membrane protein YqaA with SNARE-associated domain